MGDSILALDQGTTGTTALLLDAKNFSVLGIENKEFRQIFPSPGLVEHDLFDIWESTRTCVTDLLRKLNYSAKNIVSIGITNQRETTCAFDLEGNPLANAIVWQDRRTIPHCQQLKKEGKENFITQKTGLTIDPYFSATKMSWLLNNNESVSQNAKNKNLNFGTIDTFLLYKLTQGKSFATDGTNASRTLLMDLETCQWDQELLDLFKIPRNSLPQIMDSFGNFGVTKGLDFLPDGIPIQCLLGDQQSALIGQGISHSGEIKCTYGTGAFMLLNTGEEIKRSSAGLLTTLAYCYKGKRVYALEGSSFIGGAAVGWLRDSLGIIKESSEIEKLALQVKHLEEMEHLLFMPFFSGLGSPYWRPEAKGAILGITRDTNAAHLAMACLEGIALSINDLLGAFQKESSNKILNLKVDGGATQNNLLLQTQANVSQLEILRPKMAETTSLGAAFGAAIGMGRISLEEIGKYWTIDKNFTPEGHKNNFYNKKKEQWDLNIKKLFL